MLRDPLNRRMDALVRPHLRVLGRVRSSFQVCGYTGLALAVAVGAGLTLYRGLSLAVLAAVVATACATFFALAMATKIVVGEERLIYYHHEIAILAMVTLVLRLLGQPVLAYLDVTLLGVGTFLLCGRVGCFMVGCCHGRPHSFGVRYRHEHADAGFARPFVGVRLFPIQLVESAWVLTTVTVGVAMVLRGAAPGEALAWYVVVYDVGRFGFEFARGDASRPYRAGFSEGQWTSLLLMLVVVVAEVRGAIPLRPWHLAAAAGMIGTMAVVAVYRRLRRDARHRLLSAAHIREVAEAVDVLDAHGGSAAPHSGGRGLVNVAGTSAGILFSTGRNWQPGGEVRHYTLSAADGHLRAADARMLADLLLRLRHPGRDGQIVHGREGVFHLIVRHAGAVPAPGVPH
ncbi:MAG TPA: prolipoprotein diacylglyceryl transferase family protein, partial [Longimicrobium sp.]|nr:prolipoprotein diacylglyceryl transferase family protein [Longimicrobium sp.]